MKFIYLFAIIALLAIVSCQKEQIETTDQQNNTDKMLEFLASTGVDINSVEVSNNAFIVEGDMEITFSQVKELMSASALKSAEQYKYSSPYYCNQSNVTNVTIFIKDGVPDSWALAVRNSIDAWNSISGSKIHFAESTDQSSARVVIKTSTDNNGNWVAKGNLPSYGKPGSYVIINLKYNYYGDSKKKNTIVHELGHIIGFAHTNGKSSFCTPIHIEGTKTDQESNSVMYRYTHPWKGFTDGDVTAAQTVFPE